MQVREKFENHMVFRAKRNVYIIFSVMFGGLVVLNLVAAVFGDSSFWLAVAISSFVYACSMLWLRASQITATNDGVRLGCLFVADKSLSWDEIASAEIRVGYSVRYGSLDALRPPFRLVILPKEGIKKPPIVINVNLLSLDDLQRLCDALEARLQVTNFDRPAFMKPKVSPSSVSRQFVR
jgi:hypothetical protein